LEAPGGTGDDPVGTVGPLAPSCTGPEPDVSAAVTDAMMDALKRPTYRAAETMDAQLTLGDDCDDGGLVVGTLIRPKVTFVMDATGTPGPVPSAAGPSSLVAYSDGACAAGITEPSSYTLHGDVSETVKCMLKWIASHSGRLDELGDWIHESLSQIDPDDPDWQPLLDVASSYDDPTFRLFVSATKAYWPVDPPWRGHRHGKGNGSHSGKHGHKRGSRRGKARHAHH